MAIDRDVARVNFARFVQRSLDAARARGMTDAAIKLATGVGPSTFHRWRRGEWGGRWPEIQTVVDFCAGLEVDEEDAFAALGLRGERTATTPAPMDPDVRAILRQLADPNVSADEKQAIRLLLRRLAAMADATPPAKKTTRPRRPRKAS